MGTQFPQCGTFANERRPSFLVLLLIVVLAVAPLLAAGTAYRSVADVAQVLGALAALAELVAPVRVRWSGPAPHA